MIKARAWLSAMRLRTLPLSISGIITGSAMAYNYGAFKWSICILALLTTLGFQIVSNFANDYGDGIKGTDNDERIGPARAMQSGLLSEKELRNGIIFTAILTILISLGLIYNAFGQENFTLSIVFFLLGVSAVFAAVKYTIGDSAYGYKGLGDVFVFLFFGVVAVVGSYFLYTREIFFKVFLPAITIGLLSVAVLNLNNMRDRITDGKVNKNTLAVILGEKGSKMYHAFLISLSFAAALFYFVITDLWQWSGISLLVFIPLFIHLKRVFNYDSPALLDPELKVVALLTFAFSILFTTGMLF
ncbi:MAG: 1,4-dihydroxy-2-naphthoate octaprenyltransferase [Leeuwenhoekiella sp.]